jgi:hypothetical protein
MAGWISLPTLVRSRPMIAPCLASAPLFAASLKNVATYFPLVEKLHDLIEISLFRMHINSKLKRKEKNE